MEIGAIISVIGICISFCSLLYVIKNNKRTDVKDIEQRAQDNAVLNVKLDLISKTVNDINLITQSLTQRVTSVEESTKSAHKRIDTIEGRLNEK